MRSLHVWGYVDPKHEAGKLIQRITKEMLRATEAWTDGRHAEHDKYAELDYELAVALANATEVAAGSTVLKATKVEPSRGTTQLLRCNPYLRHPKDARTHRRIPRHGH